MDAIEYRQWPKNPDYRIGVDGSVQSRRILFSQAVSDIWKPLKINRRKDGYLVVGIRVPGFDKRKVRTHYVHTLVLEAFIGPCPDGMECLHIDGNPSNCRLDNLRWGTRTENSADSARHGTRVQGSKVGSAKLQERDIPLILLLREHGFWFGKIGDLFGVAESQIRAILDGKTWNHVTGFPKR
jgi:HNH endonuclease